MGFGQVTAIVDSDTCTRERVGHAGADFLDTDEFIIVEKFCGMVDIDGALVLHIDLFKHFIDTVAEILVVLEFVVDFPDRLVAAIAEQCNVHFHLLCKYEVPGCHCVKYIEIDRTECTWGRAAACTLEGYQLNTKFFHGLDGCRFTSRIPVRGDTAEIECEFMFCF